MSWKEVRRKIAGEVPEHFTDENDWPSPDDKEFWEVVSPLWKDEYMFLIADQAPKYINIDLNARRLLVESYLMVIGKWGMSGEQYEWEFLKVIENGEYLRLEALELAFNGPMTSIVLEYLRVPKEEQGFSMVEILKRHSEIPKKIKKSSPAVRALFWWGLWIDLNNKKQKSNNWAGPQAEETLETSMKIVRFLTEQLGLQPPEIIK